MPQAQLYVEQRLYGDNITRAIKSIRAFREDNPIVWFVLATVLDRINQNGRKKFCHASVLGK